MRSEKCLSLHWMVLYCVALLVFVRFTSSQSADQALPPEITKQIYILNGVNSNTQVNGSSTTMSIDVRGTEPLYYTWRQDNTVVVNNGTDRSYTVNNLSNTGLYRVTVANSFGKVRSLPYNMTIIELGRFPNTSDQVVRVQEGKFAVLDMPDISYISTPPQSFSVEWQQNNTAIGNDQRYFVTLDYSLALLNIPLSLNQTRFKVKFTHYPMISFIVTYSHDFILAVTDSTSQTVFEAPEFVVRPRNTSAISGQNVQVDCVVQGRPFSNVQIKWYRITITGRTELPGSNNRYSLSTDRRRLSINRVDIDDAGIYECEGSLNGQTTYSPISQKVSLSVLVPPSMSVSPPSVSRIDFQESVAFPCTAQGFPDPVITWYFNDVSLVSINNSRYRIDPNGTLSITSVDIPDSGVYQCFGVNEVGEASTYTSLVVNSAVPTIVEAPKNIVVAQDEDTAFTCIVKGGPQPEVSWKKDGVNLALGGRIRWVPNQLLIGKAEIADSGLYACTAVNIKGTVSANATLKVIGKTRIIKPPQNMSRVLSADVMLDCGVSSDPSVIVNWTWYFYPSPYFQKRNITSGVDKYQILANGSLVITGLLGKHDGKYECVVTSAGGNDQKFAVLSVIDLPGPPTITSVSLYEPIPNSVLINWTQTYDGDTPIIKFIIKSRRESSSGSNIDGPPWETVNSNVAPDLRSAFVSNLLPSRYYRFQLTAVNIVGESDPSAAAPEEAIKMPTQPPSAAPLNLYCEAKQEREISVTWDPPPESSWNGDLLGYILFYKIDGFGDDIEKIKNVSGKDVRQSVLRDVVPYKKYRVRISAYNERGPGVNSSDFFVTTKQSRPDSPPLNVTVSSPTSTSIRVQWDPPKFIQLNGVNQGYVIQLMQDGSLKNPVNVQYNEQNPTGRQTFDVTDLAKYTVYSIQIACKTEAGAGPQSPALSIRTLEDVPGPVTDLRIDNISDRSMRVNWKPPQEINGILIGYVISYQVKNNSTAESFDRSPNTSSHTLNNLSYETTYIISVRAKTQVGPGPARTTEIVSGVPPELPGPPTQLAVTNIEARSVLLQFIPGFDGKTSITLWVVEAEVDGSNGWSRIYNISDPTANEIIVYNLRPYTRYRLRILAQNIVDLSRPSEPCNQFQTKQAVPGIPPQDITPRVNSSTSIRIRWMQIPHTEWNGDSLGYRILYRRWSKDVDLNTTSQVDLDLVRETTWTSVDLSNGSTIQEYFLTRLEAWMDYEIQMFSVNAVGISNGSAVFSERTDEDVPSASPSRVTASAKSSTTIFVNWFPVPILQQNGLIQAYKVKAQRNGADPQYWEVNGASNLNITLQGLRKYTNYSIQVQASTRVGDGVLSSPVVTRTNSDVPGPPVIIYFPQVNETSATIVWLPPEEPNGVILYYRVSYKRKDQSDSALNDTSVDHPESARQYTVSRLASDTYYMFSVTAKTENGWGEAATVDVYTTSYRDRPEPPFNLRIDSSEVLSRSVSIAWTPGNDNFGPIRNFTVQFRKRGGTWQTVEGTIKPQLTSYTVKGLLPNTYYSFRVAAFNDIGMSGFSAESNEVPTKPDKPDGAPKNVKIVAVTTTSIKITWDSPAESTWNGNPTNNIVQFRAEQAVTFREETVPFDQHNAVLDRLSMGMRYEIQVLIVNEVGRGPPSVVQFFLVGEVAPFAAPSDVLVTTKSSAELEVTWSPPPDDTTNGRIIAYNIQYQESVTESCVMSNPIQRSTPELRTTLGALKPYTLYCTTVRAVNIAGEGPQSAPFPKRTSEDYPGPPSNVRFQNITLQSLTILWDPPLVPNGKIINYQLQYYTSIDKDKTDVSTRSLPGEEREQYISDLLENQNYTFTLVAINSIGKGTAVVTSRRTGPQPGSPMAPLQPVVTPSPKFITITWTNQAEGRSPIVGYICYLKEDKLQAWIPIKDITSAKPVVQMSLSDLKPNTNYSFAVRAINLDGISEQSPASQPYVTPGSVIAAKAGYFHTEWWFLVIVALSGVIAILLVITLLCCIHKRRKKGNELKRSTTITTVMSATPEPEVTRFPGLELRQSNRSVARNGKVPNTTNNHYARSPPRPSPASVTYSEGLNLPAAAAARRPQLADDASSVLSEKPSNFGDSSDDVSSVDSDASSTDSIVKAPVSSSPPPPAFSSHYGRSRSNSSGKNRSGSAGASGSSSSNNLNVKTVNAGASSNNLNIKVQQNPAWRPQNQQNNAYAYTDSEADSSHYAFSLNNGNIVVNNVAGARTPLSGFSSFV